MPLRETKKSPELSMNSKLEAVKFGDMENVDTEPEEVGQGRSKKDNKKNNKKPMSPSIHKWTQRKIDTRCIDN